MIAIIAEKPSVAREIASVVGANKKNDGYIEGNGYCVTWAFGHLITLAEPKAYGFEGSWDSIKLPMMPDKFITTPIPGQKKETEALHKKQLKTISMLFKKAQRIIVATDAGREGELIFRYLYEYIGCATPFDRLWISSLTDKAIREGLKNLECGSKYDNLYYAAKARSEADWLVGINATQAITLAAGRGTYSLGRVQTPTLAMVCKRFWENKRFTPETFHQLHFGTEHKDGTVVKFDSEEKYKDKAVAEELYNKVKGTSSATLTKVVRKEKVEDTPLLYDLTTLQKDANSKHGFTAEQTLAIAQKLYEAKLITYPRTGSRYISEDVFAEIPKLLQTLKNRPVWSLYALSIKKPTRRSVDGSKVTDHHAIIITGELPKHMSNEDMTIYDMIVGRMLEAFSEKCIKDVTQVTADCCGITFTAKGSVIKKEGWRYIYGADKKDVLLPADWNEGDTVTVNSSSLTTGQTKPKPLHTEASLLAAMETCGKDIEDDEMRQAIKDCGIGTPATRAAIIETLFARGYVVRADKALVPTEKGLALYYVVKEMQIADVTMTGEWEQSLAKIERGEMNDRDFRRGIEEYTSLITSELLSCQKIFGHKESECTCPKCGTGKMQFFHKVVRCDNKECGLPIFRQKAGKDLTDDEMKELITNGKTGVLKGFKSKQGKKFSAIVAFDSDFNTQLIFPK